MGPCRIDPFGGGAKQGICGATAETIVARNLLRNICRGTAAHSDHARDLVHALLLAAKGTSDAYKIKGPTQAPQAGRGVRHCARRPVRQRSGRRRGPASCWRSSAGRKACWPTPVERPSSSKRTGPRKTPSRAGIDREVVTGLHATNMGGDNDAEHILMTAVRTALADGWGGSMIATDVSDVLFGEPQPLRSRVNLGVLKADEVNIIVHGHEPTLSDVIVAATQDPELLAEARAKGAKGINLAGICCTANEILMRHGIPIAGNFLQQELAVMTGAVDVMLVDIQCVFPSLTRLQDAFTRRSSPPVPRPSSQAPCTSSSTRTMRWRSPRRSSASPSTISQSRPGQGTHPQAEKSRSWPASPPRWCPRFWAAGIGRVTGR